VTIKMRFPVMVVPHASSTPVGTVKPMVARPFARHSDAAMVSLPAQKNATTETPKVATVATFAASLRTATFVRLLVDPAEKPPAATASLVVLNNATMGTYRTMMVVVRFARGKAIGNARVIPETTPASLTPAATAF
jgi:hypothetical protein